MSPDEHIPAYMRMSEPLVFARPSQGYTVEHDTIRTDPGRFPDHHSHAMVAKKTTSNTGSGMDFHAGKKSANL